MGPEQFVAQRALMQYVLCVLVVIAACPVHPRPLDERLEHDLVIRCFALCKSRSLFIEHFIVIITFSLGFGSGHLVFIGSVEVYYLFETYCAFDGHLPL